MWCPRLSLGLSEFVSSETFDVERPAGLAGVLVTPGDVSLSPARFQVSQWYELVVFTASMEIYGSAVADKLDNSRSILKRRYYRQVRGCPPERRGGLEGRPPGGI